MTKSRVALPLLAALLLLLSAATPASAHGAAPPKSYVTRLLSDYSDDWLGVQDGHNVIALDGYTQYNASLGDVVVLRFILDGGYAKAGSTNPELAEHVTFKAAGKDQEFAIHTEDNKEFSSEVGFAAVRGPFVQTTADGTTPDGTRFFVEGLIPFGNLSIKAGDALSGFYVQGEAGDGEGDAMPQDALVPGSDAGTLPDPDGVEADIGSWTVPAPRFVTAALAGTAPSRVPASGEVTVDLSVANLQNDTAQSVMVMASGEGVLVSFTGAPTAKDAMGMLDLAAGKSGKLTLHVARAASAASTNMTMATSATAGASGSHNHAATSNATMAVPDAHGLVMLNVTSSLGGHVVLPVHLEVAQPAPVATNTTTEHVHGDAKKSPGLGAGVLILSAVALVVVRRRTA